MKKNILILYYLRTKNKTDKYFPIEYNNQKIDQISVDLQIFWDKLSINQRLIILLGKEKNGLLDIRASSLSNSDYKYLKKAIRFCSFKWANIPPKLKYLLWGILHYDLLMINDDFFNHMKSINPQYPMQQFEKYCNIILELNKVSESKIDQLGQFN